MYALNFLLSGLACFACVGTAARFLSEIVTRLGRDTANRDTAVTRRTAAVRTHAWDTLDLTGWGS